MVSDENYWKNQYKNTWKKSSARENYIAKLVLEQIGLKANPVGLGAGSDRFISGNAKRHGHKKGDADLHLEGTDIYLEVTGPLSTYVDSSEPLWIRPDKLRNAESRIPEHDTWLVHHLAKDNTLRVIHLNEYFFLDARDGHFEVVEQEIRGALERYVSIEPSHPCVKPWTIFVEHTRFIKAILDI